MKTAFVKPAPGLKVRRPDRPSEILAVDGDTVILDDYWRNRLRDGDVVAVAPTHGKSSAGPKAQAKKEG